MPLQVVKYGFSPKSVQLKPHCFIRNILRGERLPHSACYQLPATNTTIIQAGQSRGRQVGLWDRTTMQKNYNLKKGFGHKLSFTENIILDAGKKYFILFCSGAN